MNIEYKHSGNPGNIHIVGLLVGAPLFLLVSIARAYLEVHVSSFNIIYFLITLAGIFIIRSIIIRLSKCRSETVAKYYATAMAIISIYANWCAYFYFDKASTGNSPDLKMYLSDPLSILTNMSEYAETSVYHLYRKSRIRSPYFSLALWVIDAVLIFSAARFQLLHKKIFCEDCNKWADDCDYKLKLSLPENQKEAFAIDVNIMSLLELPSPESPNSKCIQLNIHQCTTCTNTNTLDIDLLTYTTDKRGKISENKKDYSPVYVLTSAQVDQFLRKKP